MKDFIVEWFKAIPASAKFQRNDLTEITEQMLKDKAFSTPWITYDGQAHDNDLQIQPILREFGYIPKKSKIDDINNPVTRNAIKGVKKILDGFGFVGGTLETTTKVAGYQTLKKRQAGARKAGFLTRNYVGTPNFITGGTQKQVDNNVWVFANVAIQGMKADIELATDPKTRGGYWMKMFMIDILPKLAMLAGAAGLFGDKIKELYEKMTEYDKTNYVTIPLGETKNGRAVYWRIPQDETGRLFSAMTWKLGTYAIGKGKKPDQLLSLGVGAIPSPTPLINIGTGWINYLKGRNPYDHYRGRLVINDRTWKAGGLPVFTKMLQYTTNELGLTQFATYDDKRDTTFEAVLKQTPILERAFKISDFGLTEEFREISRKVDRENARENIRIDKIINEQLNRVDNKETTLPQATNTVIREAFGKPPYSKEIVQKIGRIRKKVRVKHLYDHAAPELSALISANTNEARVEMLKLYKERMTQEEWEELKKIIVKERVVNPNLLFKVK